MMFPFKNTRDTNTEELSAFSRRLRELQTADTSKRFVSDVHDADFGTNIYNQLQQLHTDVM